MRGKKDKEVKRPRIGLIGCGIRGASLMYVMKKVAPNAVIAGIADFDKARALHRLRKLEGVQLDKIPFFVSDDALLENADNFDGLIIATRCHQHTNMAVKAARTGLPLYLEKPVAVNRAQLAALAKAYRGREDQVVVSFPLRLTPVFLKAREIIQSGLLGPVNQIQAINNVTYGGHYYGGHYRNYDESGGLWLQKATHDFDYINELMNMRPEWMAAMSTRKIFGGDKPHNLRCSKCKETKTCMESPRNVVGKRGGDYGGGNWDDGTADHLCMFSRDIRNQDAGSALIQYADGTHASYDQEFVTRHSSWRRGAIITGYSGTLEFSFDGALRIDRHHSTRKERKLTITAKGSHGGGDEVLMRNFLEVACGKASSRSPLTAGILSAAMALAARESAARRKFVKITLPPAASWPYPKQAFKIRSCEPV